MGQQQDQPGLPDPLSLAWTYELIDDALSSVAEVSELRLPAHQGIGVGHTVAQLEPKDTVLGQGAVAHGVRRLVGVQVAQRPVRGFVNSLVVQHMMTMTENDNIYY